MQYCSAFSPGRLHALVCYHMDARHNLSFCVIGKLCSSVDACGNLVHGIAASKKLFHRYTRPVPRMGTTEGSMDKVRDGLGRVQGMGPTELAPQV